ncbi:MAG: hypothetical protein FWD77_01180 [Betaproteobacteria bacterium]|nr:hypothetical protein [Betaproteobacteria bacterium]
MSETRNKIRLFEERQVRAIWDEEAEKWWLSVVDVVAVLTGSDYQAARKYWKVLKGRLTAEGNESVTSCYQLKMQAADGKFYKTDAADTEQVLRLIQSIPSKKAEPFKRWLAKVGNERIDESIDPELSIERAIQNYRHLGYSENWINQRIKSIEVRKALTDEWDKSGVKQGEEYATLTDLMSRTWSGMNTREYRQYKGLKKENLRDNMTNMELILNMFAEAAATEISMVEQPEGFNESAKVASRGANAAKVARKQLEKETGKSAVSRLNAKDLGARRLPDGNEGGGG